MYSASALAANTIVRSAVGAGFPMFTVQSWSHLFTDLAGGGLMTTLPQCMM